MYRRTGMRITSLCLQFTKFLLFAERAHRMQVLIFKPDLAMFPSSEKSPPVLWAAGPYSRESVSIFSIKRIFQSFIGIMAEVTIPLTPQPLLNHLYLLMKKEYLPD